MPLSRSRDRSELPVTAHTNRLLNKIAALYAQSPRHVVIQMGAFRANAANLQSVVLDETLGSANVQFKRAPFTATAATATLDLTADIALTSVATGAARNTTTFTVQVAAAAANPTDTILANFTGTSAAIVCTITPNDGTNNAATPVNLTTAELRELITTGAVSGKTVTITDGSSLRALQTATGGGATNLADAGEGDGVVATFSNGVTASSVENYDTADIQIIKRLRTKKWLIKIKATANPA